MLVSFLIPTRNRIESLIGGIQSITQKASSDVQLEILARVDEDDYVTLAARNQIQAEIIVGPRWCGYNSAHLFFNEMAAKSHGDWIFPWNDDIFMVTKKWDKLLPPASKSTIIWITIPGSWTWAHPVMSRRLYDAWGCFSYGVPCDAWILNQWMAAGGVPDPNIVNSITVDHRRDEANILANGIRTEDCVAPPASTAPKQKDFVKLLRDLM